MGSVARMTKPYRAATKGKWQEVGTFYENHNELVRAPLTVTGDTALHFAMHCENTDSLEILLRILKESEFFQPESTPPYQITNGYGHTALHEAAAAGNLEAVKLLLRCDKGLLPIPNNRGETALFRAAAFGRTNVVKFLASEVQVMEPHVMRKDKTSILHIAILGRYFGTVFFFYPSPISQIENLN